MQQKSRISAFILLLLTLDVFIVEKTHVVAKSAIKIDDYYNGNTERQQRCQGCEGEGDSHRNKRATAEELRAQAEIQRQASAIGLKVTFEEVQLVERDAIGIARAPQKRTRMTITGADFYLTRNVMTGHGSCQAQTREKSLSIVPVAGVQYTAYDLLKENQKQKIQTLEELVSTLTAKDERLQSRVRKLLGDIDNLDYELVRKNQEVASMRTKAAQQERRYDQQQRRYDWIISSKDSEIAKWRNDVLRKDATIAGDAQAKRELQNKIWNLDAWRRIDDREKQELDQKLSLAIEKMDRQDNRNKAIIEKLKGEHAVQLREKQSQVNLLQSRLDSAKGNNEALKRELETIKRDLEAMKRSYEPLKKTNENLSLANLKLVEESGKLRKAADKLRQERTDDKVVIADLKKDLEQAMKQAKNEEADKEKLRKTFEEIYTKFNIAQDQLGENSEQMRKMRGQIEKLLEDQKASDDMRAKCEPFWPFIEGMLYMVQAGKEAADELEELANEAKRTVEQVKNVASAKLNEGKKFVEEKAANALNAVQSTLGFLNQLNLEPENVAIQARQHAQGFFQSAFDVFAHAHDDLIRALAESDAAGLPVV